jgi:dTDP-glucose 4,6-dehydratase
MDWSKIKGELGWKPLYGFDDWLEKTVAWYTKHREWWMRVKSGEYQSYYEQQYGG